MAPAPRQRLAAYALLRDEGRVLMARLAPPLPAAGKWTLPGGGLEFGEHPEQTVVREVREETGLEIRVSSLLQIQSDVFDVNGSPFHALRFFYRAEIVGGQLCDEAAGTTDMCRWVPREEIARLPLVPMARHAVGLIFPRGNSRRGRRNG